MPSDSELAGGGIEPAVAINPAMGCGSGGTVARLTATTEGDFTSPITAGAAAGVAFPDAVILEFSAVFFSADFPGAVRLGSSGPGVVGANARALCKVLAKLLGTGPALWKGRAELLAESEGAASA